MPGPRRSATRVLLMAAVAAASCGIHGLPPPPSRDAPSPRLATLRREREGTEARRTYRIAPGDVLEVRTHLVKEITGSFRVSQKGVVVLPLVGAVRVAGLTEAGAAESVRTGLGAFVVQPEVTLSISEFGSQRVSVVGAIGRPGIYALRSSKQTVADLLTEAGGITRGAGPTLLFSPGHRVPAGAKLLPGQTRPIADAVAQLGLAAAGDLVRGRPDAIAIDLTRLYEGRSVPELGLPVRGGDTIVVPPGGQVFVDGWVNVPGGYPLARGMTLTAAVSHAGGLTFAARRGVRLSRPTGDGVPETFGVDYARVVEGAEPDPYLETGDRVEVAANPLKVVPWAVYRVVANVFSFSAGGQVDIVEAR